MLDRIIQALRDIFDDSHKREIYEASKAKREIEEARWRRIRQGKTDGNTRLSSSGVFINALNHNEQNYNVKERSKLGRTVYSSKTQSELEVESGEKLYQVGENVYINQNTKDRIDSEPPIEIHEEDAREFDKLVYSSENIKCSVWHPTNRILIAIKLDNGKLICIVFDEVNYNLTVESETEIPLLFSIDDVTNLSHHSKKTLILITCKQYLIVWNYFKNDVTCSVKTDGNEFVSGGFYPESRFSWSLRLSRHRADYEWVILDVENNEYSTYTVEHEDHYSRGSTLHPSGLLIGANWNAYSCGYYVHESQPRGDHLHYFVKPSSVRREYEAYNPCFSPNGQYFAFIVNPFLAMHQNYSKVVVYDIETAELKIEFHTGSRSFGAYGLKFAHSGRTLIFYETNSHIMNIFNAESGRKIASLNLESHISYLSAHRLYGYYTVIENKGITVFMDRSDEEALDKDFDMESKEVAERFIKENTEYLIEVGDYFDDGE
jgi:hypothetical protein